MVDHRPNILGTDKNEKGRVDDRCQKQVEKGAGSHNQDAFIHIFVGERVGNQLRFKLGVGFIPHHLDVTAQWNGGDAVIGQANGFAEKTRTEPQGEFFDTDPKKSGDKEMAQFVKKNEHPKDNHKGKNIRGHKRIC